MAMKILVTGGAGYIGSHTVAELQKAGHQAVVFDNLTHGHREAVTCPLVVGDLLNRGEIGKVFRGHRFDGVIHFAAYALAGESMKEPARYFENNLQGGLNLLEAMREHQVSNLVFSSTCAVYGYPDQLPVSEEESKKPVSVYGESKLMFERILSWYDRLYTIRSVSLRYFNACGASLDGSIGEDHRPESHIIPITIEVALGKREKFVINGDNYNTADGTCVRDYIHVLDLASAHLKALEQLVARKKSDFFNVGTGRGYSNKEIIEAVKKVSGVDFLVEVGPRREGDPDAIYADNTKIKKVLSWAPKYSDLETILKTAWNWHHARPQGY